MNTLEKILSIIALLFLFGLILLLFFYPPIRAPKLLIPGVFIGFFLNMTLLFIVFRDVFSRPFSSKSKQYFWSLLILLFQPAVIVYLIKYGFKPRRISCSETITD